MESIKISTECLLGCFSVSNLNVPIESISCVNSFNMGNSVNLCYVSYYTSIFDTGLIMEFSSIVLYCIYMWAKYAISLSWFTHWCFTVNVERFAGLNIRGFSPIKLLRKYFCDALATNVYYLPIAKNSRKNFRGTLKTAKV